ncbi:isochorismatase family protein [Staphylococcus chromogenes]|nr:isochorismatase family protein [Staphylococcus chromogenes]
MSEKCALVIVDTQNDFCPGGALPAPNANEAAMKIANLVRSNHSYDYVVATKDWHIDPGKHFSETPDFEKSWPVHCKAFTLGAEFHPVLELALFDHPLDAEFPKGQYTPVYSGFEGAYQGELLESWLKSRGVGTIDVVGIATDYVVRETVLDGLKLGFKVNVLTEMIAAIHADRGERALAEMAAAGATLVQ